MLFGLLFCFVLCWGCAREWREGGRGYSHDDGGLALPAAEMFTLGGFNPRPYSMLQVN